MTNAPIPTDEGVVTTSSNVSIWEDFIDIFHSPSAVFARRQNSGFWIPMLIVTLAIGLVFLATSGLLQPMMDADFHRGMAAAMKKNPQLTEDQLAGMQKWGETFAKIGVFIFVPIGIFLNGFFLWAIGKLFDASESLRTAIVVAAYAMIPRIVEALLAGVQGLLLDPASFTSRYSISLGVGRFLNPDTTSPVVLALVGRVDVFTIWVTVLLAIGLAVTGKIPRARAGLAAACLWVLGAVPALLQALRS